MATGALDANGVWQYGEDDLLSPWSAYMNKLGQSVSDLVGPWGKWTAYTPTVGGITIGNGSIEAYRTNVGKTHIARVEITLGTTSAVTGEVSFTLPVTAKYGRRTGSATGRISNSGNPYGLACWSASSTTVQLIRYTGTNGLLTALSATAPGTWGATGWIEAEVTFEAA